MYLLAGWHCRALRTLYLIHNAIHTSYNAICNARCTEQPGWVLASGYLPSNPSNPSNLSNLSNPSYPGHPVFSQQSSREVNLQPAQANGRLIKEWLLLILAPKPLPEIHPYPIPSTNSTIYHLITYKLFSSFRDILGYILVSTEYPPPPLKISND